MAYDKNTWKSGDVVTSAKLNNIENGIANKNGKITVVMGDPITLSASYNEIMTMFDNGIMPFFYAHQDDGHGGTTTTVFNVTECSTYIDGDNTVYSVTFGDNMMSAEASDPDAKLGPQM